MSQERTGAGVEEGGEVSGTSAVQQVEEAFGIPVVSVVGLTHLTEFMAAKGSASGTNAEVKSRLVLFNSCPTAGPRLLLVL